MKKNQKHKMNCNARNTPLLPLHKTKILKPRMLYASFLNISYFFTKNRTLYPISRFRKVGNMKISALCWGGTYKSWQI